MSPTQVFLDTLRVGLANGTILALIAIGYTMVYGIIELINFAHGDLFMLGSFLALTLMGLLGLNAEHPSFSVVGGGLSLIFVMVPVFTAGLNWLVHRWVYRPLQTAHKLVPLVATIGVSFLFENIGLLWAGLPLDVFGNGQTASAMHHVPDLIPETNVLGHWAFFQNVPITLKDVLVIGVTLPLLVGLTFFVKGTRTGKAMRATSQDPLAAQLMGIDVQRMIGMAFILGGALAGFASVIYSLYNNTIFFRMGFRVGLDAFTAAVLGGIGNLPGAALGGVVIGVIRSLSDVYIATQWTNALVFSLLILILIFFPAGLLGERVREKV